MPAKCPCGKCKCDCKKKKKDFDPDFDDRNMSFLGGEAAKVQIAWVLSNCKFAAPVPPSSSPLPQPAPLDRQTRHRMLITKMKVERNLLRAQEHLGEMDLDAVLEEGTSSSHLSVVRLSLEQALSEVQNLNEFFPPPASPQPMQPPLPEQRPDEDWQDIPKNDFMP